jgi:hypothetical protein
LASLEPSVAKALGTRLDKYRGFAALGKQMAAKKEKQKLCFVVGPIGHDDSDDRMHADWLLEEIIQPVFEEHFPEFKVERADKISNPGRIDAQVITALLDAELVIADLTTLNPNAFYEIGIRHTIQKPVIHMHLEGQSIPFDISSFRSIKFSRKWPKDIRSARKTLQEFVTTVLAEDYEVDNPVTFSRGKVEFEKTATRPQKIVFDQLASIQSRLSELEQVNRPRQMSILDDLPFSGNVLTLLLKTTPGTPYRSLTRFIEISLPTIFSTFKISDEGEGEGELLLHIEKPFNLNKLNELKSKASKLGISVHRR